MTSFGKAAVVFCAIGVCVFILIWACFAEASPFLVCDPTSENVEQYEIEVNGVVEPAVFENVGTDQVRIKHDLGGWPDGQYSIRARAGNIWGWSPWSDPFDFPKAIPSRVGGLGIEE